MPKKTAKKKIEAPSCSECTVTSCHRREKRFPGFCLTEGLDGSAVSSALANYTGDGTDAKIARAAAEVEGLYYGKLTRVEETLAFAKRIGAKEIGIATCVGLIEETRIFAKFLRLGGMEPYTAACKIGSADKTDIGIPEEWKIKSGSFEACCNPALQAQVLNERKTDLNIIIGLCVGHDSIFNRHSDAPVTTLIAKDRVLAHNPAAALYTVASYHTRLLDEERVRAL